MSLGAQLRLVRLFAGLVGRLPAGHLAYLARRIRREKLHVFGGDLRINSFFPPYPSPAFERFRRAVIARRRVPCSAYLAVTGDCPYRCPHCSYARRRPGSLSQEKLLAVIAEIKALGTATLGLTGGASRSCATIWRRSWRPRGQRWPRSSSRPATASTGPARSAGPPAPPASDRERVPRASPPHLVRHRLETRRDNWMAIRCRPHHAPSLS